MSMIGLATMRKDLQAAGRDMRKAAKGVLKGVQGAAKSVQKVVKDVQAGVRAHIIECKTSDLEFALRHRPRLFNLPRLPSAIAYDSMVSYFNGRELAMAMGTCKAFRNAIIGNQRLKARADKARREDAYAKRLRSCGAERSWDVESEKRNMFCG